MLGMKRKRTSFESFENSRGKFCGKIFFGGKKHQEKPQKKTTNNKITFKMTCFTFFSNFWPSTHRGPTCRSVAPTTSKCCFDKLWRRLLYGVILHLTLNKIFWLRQKVIQIKSRKRQKPTTSMCCFHKLWRRLLYGVILH